MAAGNEDMQPAQLAPWISRQLQALVQRQGHAWLLAGPGGLNQFDLALALARAWLCDSPQGGIACGHCESCHMVKAHTHPDLRVLLPQELALALHWGEEEPEAAGSDDKKRKPSKEIRIEALRTMIEFTQRTAARRPGQVVVIYPAERMNTVSANTLLKTLEEPPGHTRFILVSENAQRLLPTIRSRCQVYQMHWPEPAEALAWLEQQGVETPQVLLAAAGGRPALAVQLVEQGMTAQKWQQIPRGLAQGQMAVLEDMTPAQMLDTVGKLCHDLLAVQTGATPRFFDLKHLPQKVNRPLVLAWSQEIMQASRKAEHPWNATLYAQALLSRAQQVLSG